MGLIRFTLQSELDPIIKGWVGESLGAHFTWDSNLKYGSNWSFIRCKCNDGRPAIVRVEDGRFSVIEPDPDLANQTNHVCTDRLVIDLHKPDALKELRIAVLKAHEDANKFYTLG